MSLKERLAADLKTAMKEKDTIRKNTVQMVRAGVLQVEKDKQITLDDDGVIEVLSKEVKKRRDVLPEYEKSGREDLVGDLKREIEVLAAYLPAQLSASELEAIVKQTIDEMSITSMKEIGKLMGAVLPKVKGKADGRMVNELAKKLLTE